MRVSGFVCVQEGERTSGLIVCEFGFVCFFLFIISVLIERFNYLFVINKKKRTFCLIYKKKGPIDSSREHPKKMYHVAKKKC